MKIKNKKYFKKYIKTCFFCNENNLNLLDVHRIYEGYKGGSYHHENVLVLCANCHRKVHSGEIKNIKKHKSYGGNSLYQVIYFINNIEYFKSCDY